MQSVIETVLPRMATQTGDEPTALRVWNTNNAGAYTLEWDDSKFIFKKDAALDTLVNPDSGTTAGEITDAEAATIGAFADLVNANSSTSFWHAAIVDSLRAYDTTDIDTLAETAVTRDGVDLKWDVSELNIYVLCMGQEGLTLAVGGEAPARQSTVNDNAGREPSASPTSLPALLTSEAADNVLRPARVGRLSKITSNLTSAGTILLSVYDASQSADGDPIQTRVQTTSATEQTWTFGANELVSSCGRRLVIAATGSGATALSAGTLQLLGTVGAPGQAAS